MPTTSRSDDRAQDGTSLVELVVVLALVGLLIPIFAPRIERWRRMSELRGAGWNLALTATALRAAASASTVRHGLVFDTGERPGWVAVRDGDGDGIGRVDVDAGTDPRVSQATRLEVRHPGVFFGLPAGSAGLGGSPVTRAVTFAAGGVLTFTPDGSSSSGTVYLRNAHGDAVALRVYGPTARITLWASGDGAGGWRRYW